MPKTRKWVIRENYARKGAAEEIAGDLSVELITAALLVSRGYDTPEKAQRFLSKADGYFHDPFLMKDMYEAVTRILKAVDDGEKITVYGDYDVDGVTSVSALYLYLKSLGADVDFYIPNRSGEGYGVSIPAVEKLKESGTSLMVTVDTGTTAVKEAEFMKSCGMDLVVTDHHSCQGGLPDACAVVNPMRPDDTYPFKELAGVGVVFKLLTALEFAVQERTLTTEDERAGLTFPERIGRFARSGKGDPIRKICGGYIDLVAVGTIADVMSLTDENRLICSAGLKLIENSPRPGLAALMDMAADMNAKKFPKKRKVTSSYIGYTIAPRINAAGRLADARIGVELFITDDRKEAERLAGELCDLNVRRQAEENRIAAEAIEMAEKTHDFEHDPVLVLASEKWHHGVIGIVSSRLTEKYNLPSILISVEDGVGKGSGRSIKGFNIVKALAACGDHLIRYGGHELAAGLTVEVGKIDDFRRAINECARMSMDPEACEATLEIDAEINASDITLGLAEELTSIEPCGVGNPQPVFMIRNAVISDASAVGNGKHTKLTVETPGGGVAALSFGTTLAEADLVASDHADIVFRLDVNEFQGRKSPQLMLIDAHIPEYDELYGSECRLLERIEKGEPFLPEDGILPDRDDFAVIFRTLRRLSAEGNTYSLYRLHKKVAEAGGYMRPAKLKLAMRILKDVGLISLDILAVPGLSGSELYRIAVPSNAEKINLFGTPRYKRLKASMKASVPH